MAKDAQKMEIDTEAWIAKIKSVRLTDREAKSALKSAFRKSLGIIRTSVRNGARTVTSNPEKVRKGVNEVIYKNGFGGQVNIYATEYMSSMNGRVFSLRWLERGTRDVTGRNGRKHGATPAKPFFENSVSSATPAARQILSDNILAYIDKKVAKRK